MDGFDDREALSDCLDALGVLEDRLRVLSVCRGDMRFMVMSHQMGGMREQLAKYAALRRQPFEHPYLA